jgi:hypothetical protein
MNYAGNQVPGTGYAGNPRAYAPAVLLQELLQDFAYSYRVWITLNKLLYAPLQHPHPGSSIHAFE